MRYGDYDDDRREYVISTPDTPTPWINYLGTEDFHSLISNTGGGYCFYRDARLRRLTRYRYNNRPVDSDGRYFYVRDAESDEAWSLGHAPMRRPLDHYECRHGMGYTTIASRKNDIASELMVFVPRGVNAEVMVLTLKNHSQRARRLRMFSYVEFCLWNALEDQTNFQRNLSVGEVEVEGSTIYHTTEYRERRDHFAFYSVNHPVVGFDTDREAFLGRYRGPEAPLVVEEGEPRDSRASGWSPIASHCVDVRLEPNEVRELIFVLGYAENDEAQKWSAPGVVNKSPAEEVVRRFQSIEQVDHALEELREYWEGLLRRYQLDARDDRLSRMVNTWNPYQCVVTFHLSRSASYYESGIGRGMGFRDCNQDLLGVVHMLPEQSRQRILDLAATQFPDGSAYHQYQPLTKRGNHDVGGGFNDDPLWLVLSTCEYTKETGDYEILEEEVPFDHNPDDCATLLEHLHRSFGHVTDNLGPHGLPLIGRADWNDCLNLNCFSKNPDESFQTTDNTDGRVAESVMIAGLFVFAGDEYVRLLRHLGHTDRAQEAAERIARMRQTVLDHGFDGEWFLRAYDASGQKVGSSANREGQIFVEPQGFCTMAGIGRDEGLCEKALDAAGRRLAGEHGIVLQDPPYSRYYPELGEISSYPPGYKENAGIFCHNNPWIMIGEALLGRGDRAYDYYRRIAPAFRAREQELHHTEPYVYSQMIAGPAAPNSGQAKNSWLTGTAAWNYVAATQYLLGIRAEHDGLRIDPVIAEEIGPFQVRRVCRGAEYVISVEFAEYESLQGVTVNGELIEGSLIPHNRPGSRTYVEISLAHRGPDQPRRQAAEVDDLEVAKYEPGS